MKQLLHRYAQLSTPPHTSRMGNGGLWKAGQYISQKALETFSPSTETERLAYKTIILHHWEKKKRKHYHIKTSYHCSLHHWHWEHTSLLRPTAYLWQSPWGTDTQISHDNQCIAQNCFTQLLWGEKKNEGKNSHGQTWDVSLLQDSAARLEKSLCWETTDWKNKHTLLQNECWHWK